MNKTARMKPVHVLDIPAIPGRHRSHSLWQNPLLEKRFFTGSFFLALAFHGMLLLIGGFAFVRQAEYGIEASRGGMEIYMIAALPKELPQGSDLKTQPVPVRTGGDMEMAVSQAVEKQGDSKSTAQTKRMQVSTDDKYTGDGSSAVPGKSKTTFASAGGAETAAKPGYLKNPPPSYPPESIQRRQEGLVTLSVLVDRAGKPKKVTVEQSSGFYLLDQSALRAVKKWKFSPGRMGMLTAESRVMVPIRFRLEDLQSSRK